MIEKVYGKKKLETRQITMIGLLFAITIVLGATGLGFFPIPPFKTTIMHIPVIIGGIIGGPIVGAFTGLLFGIFSIIQAINTPTPVSFVFLNPLVAVLPRILIGVISYYVYRLIRKKSEKIGVIAGIIAGTLTNTIGVLSMIYLLYINAYAKALHLSYSVAVKSLFLAGSDCIISVGAALIISIPIITVLKKLKF
ncbi:ECF transporter S component [Clostridium hydrogenum]|uniref:ECF transporter S component n=1 Tax=Clostridium hydrogenum TaxID=2855764 RepID=UPI001F392926|nr:ECF transporter S component [Clostridium hydrogenum]